jgi:hypothetical protein
MAAFVEKMEIEVAELAAGGLDGRHGADEFPLAERSADRTALDR